MDFIIFLAVLSVLIVVHELGHLLMALRLGIKVEKFSIGFGKKLFSRKIKGIDCMICAIPLGGYVKMAGDERTESKGDPAEFYSKPPGYRALVIFMGPVVNYVLAYFCFVAVFMLGYIDVSQPAKEIAPIIGGLQKSSPAQIAGSRLLFACVTSSPRTRLGPSQRTENGACARGRPPPHYNERSLCSASNTTAVACRGWRGSESWK